MAHPLAWGLEKSGVNVTGAIEATKIKVLGKNKNMISGSQKP